MSFGLVAIDETRLSTSTTDSTAAAPALPVAGDPAQRVWRRPREIGYGPIGDRLYCVVYTRRHANALRIISLRKANNREVTRYENATKAD